MSLTRTLMRFAFLTAIGHQVTATLVEGRLFEETRQRLSSLHPRADQFVHCHLCVGTWVGVALASIYRPNLLAEFDATSPGPARRIANLAGDAVLIALGTRVWNEVLGWLRREVEVKQKAIEAVDEAQAVEEDEEEAPMHPGISIRPRAFGISGVHQGGGISRIAPLSGFRDSRM